MCAATERNRTPVPREYQKMVIEAVKKNNSNKMRNILPLVLNLEFRSEEGKTPLYIACEKDEYVMARLLLNYSADPNARSSVDNSTPVLITGTTGNKKIMEMLIRRGGDVRLHDARGRGIRDYVKLNSNPISRMSMLTYLDHKRKALKAFIGTDAKQPQAELSSYPELPQEENYAELAQDPQFARCSVNNLGYGNIFYEDQTLKGLVGVIPIVTDTELTDDRSAEPQSFPVGNFMEIKSQFWGHVRVSVKDVSDHDCEAWVRDLLLNECHFMQAVRHPAILVLMGVCVAEPITDIRLVFERVQPISLNGLLHNQQYKIKLDIFKKNKLMKQVTTALLYLHQMKLLHCSISSQAIFLTKNDDAKLGNFEYMIKSCDTAKFSEQSRVIKERYLKSGYQWMAREILLGEPPNQQTDIYSLCVVIWEMLHEKKPFADLSFQEAKSRLKQSTPLQINHTISSHLREILKFGLSAVAEDRPCLVKILDKLDMDWKFQNEELRSGQR